jgi:outer membrane lipoprotein-sorting protein
MTSAGRRRVRGVPAARALAIPALVSLLAASCSPALLKLPSGPRTPASDGASAIDQATAACRTISTITLEMSVRGSVGAQRLRGRLSAGLAKPASARLEAVASFGQPAFFFVATGDSATLYVPRDQHVAHGRPDALLEAVAGVPLDPSALRSVVTGCAAMPNAAATQTLGADWRVTVDGSDEIYLRRDPATMSWRLVATLHRSTAPGAGSGATGPSTSLGAGWRAEYSNFESGLPRTIRLVSTPAGRFDLQLELSQVELNMPLGADVFQLQVPASAQTVTVDELRRSGPLGGK